MRQFGSSERRHKLQCGRIACIKGTTEARSGFGEKANTLIEYVGRKIGRVVGCLKAWVGDSTSDLYIHKQQGPKER